ncbi:MAG: hypothetical protein WA197_17535 [Candidatus Acidiferrales bacterium]
MANTSAAGNSYRSARRSTRRDQAIQVTVSGVDSRRGPYIEKVSTLTISCHGCKYPSKYQVLPDAWVTLELTPEKTDAPKVSARGRVKWVKRDGESSGPFYTAVEFESPYNIWKIDSPPEDWLQFGQERKLAPEPVRPKPVAVLQPNLAIANAKAEHAKLAATTSERLFATSSASVAANGNRAVGNLMGEFQQQMELMISELASAAVTEKTASLLNNIRSGMHEDARAILSDVAASQSTEWAQRSLQQIERTSQAGVRALHTQWTKRIDSDFNQSLQRIEARQREVEVLSETLFANALERLQQTLETFHKEAVERIILRLKERMAPAFREARDFSTELATRQEELQKTFAEASEKTAAKIEETCARLEKQFEVVMHARMDAAHEELERAATGVASFALENIRTAAGRNVAETQARLQESSERTLSATQVALEQKAAGTSNDFANELTHYSRSHLDFVSGAIAEIAKGIGKQTKD